MECAPLVMLGQTPNPKGPANNVRTSSNIILQKNEKNKNPKTTKRKSAALQERDARQPKFREINIISISIRFN
jgi:hypothetical protein